MWFWPGLNAKNPNHNLYYYHTQYVPIPTLTATVLDQPYQHHVFFDPRFHQTKFHVFLQYEKRGQLYCFVFFFVGDDICLIRELYGGLFKKSSKMA